MLSLKCFKRRRDQELTDSNRLARLGRSRQLLERCIYVVCWWKDFHCRGAVKFAEWSCVCCPWYAEETDCCQTTSSNTKHVQPVDHGFMVSVGVSKLGWTELFFVDSGTKINGSYYRDILLRQKLLLAIRRVSGKNFIFQQDTAAAHEVARAQLQCAWRTPRRTNIVQVILQSMRHRLHVNYDIRKRFIRALCTCAWNCGGSASRNTKAASDRMREHWNSSLAGQAFFLVLPGVIHFTCDLC